MFVCLYVSFLEMRRRGLGWKGGGGGRGGMRLVFERGFLKDGFMRGVFERGFLRG